MNTERVPCCSWRLCDLYQWCASIVHYTTPLHYTLHYTTLCYTAWSRSAWQKTTGTDDSSTWFNVRYLFLRLQHLLPAVLPLINGEKLRHYYIPHCASSQRWGFATQSSPALRYLPVKKVGSTRGGERQTVPVQRIKQYYRELVSTHELKVWVID